MIWAKLVQNQVSSGFLMVKFTAKFAVDNPKGELAYHAFIKDLRERLGTAGDIIKDVPILAPQVALGGVLEFFDIDLSHHGCRIYLRLRTDNLSLIAIVHMTLPPGVSWALRIKIPH
ncbi:hypothetical protein D9757_012865 [Collybiopsis confluens]|uniref:Uncharacterized protein n=1 Tax=Collybiopsis confluens TaxID=2823264 RepID=A0A8H5G1J7_9AGAR|nr:hypothetical protein D9757_012865 [Collybiopsis confluens]